MCIRDSCWPCGATAAWPCVGFAAIGGTVTSCCEVLLAAAVWSWPAAGMLAEDVYKRQAQQLNMEFYDSDQEIEKRTGADVGWVFDVEGEEGFRDREEKIINELTEKQGIVLATGGGSVKSRETRNRLSARGVVVYLETTIEKQLARTQRDKKRPLLQVDAPPREVLEALADERNPLYEEIADVTIRTDDQSAKVVANQIIHMLESN